LHRSCQYQEIARLGVKDCYMLGNHFKMFLLSDITVSSDVTCAVILFIVAWMFKVERHIAAIGTSLMHLQKHFGCDHPSRTKRAEK
jgi:hypothetical protein